MKINRVDHSNNNVPILYNREIDEFAHAVLEDYKPGLLRKPGAIRFEHFLESYLGATILYKDIYYDDPECPVFAAAVFRDGIFKVFDRENICISNMLVRANTVIIDNLVTKPGREGLAMFTGLHEGGHILIHPGVYETFRAGQICCRKENIEHTGNYGESRSPKTAGQWLEHQANYFAASIAMPDATFKPFVNEFLREHGIWKGSITLGSDDDLDIIAKDLLPESIAEVYGVSKLAASIKLKKCSFIAGPKKFI